MEYSQPWSWTYGLPLLKQHKLCHSVQNNPHWSDWLHTEIGSLLHTVSYCLLKKKNCLTSRSMRREQVCMYPGMEAKGSMTELCLQHKALSLFLSENWLKVVPNVNAIKWKEWPRSRGNIFVCLITILVLVSTEPIGSVLSVLPL